MGAKATIQSWFGFIGDRWRSSRLGRRTFIPVLRECRVKEIIQDVEELAEPGTRMSEAQIDAAAMYFTAAADEQLRKVRAEGIPVISFATRSRTDRHAALKCFVNAIHGIALPGEGSKFSPPVPWTREQREVFVASYVATTFISDEGVLLIDETELAREVGPHAIASTRQARVRGLKPFAPKKLRRAPAHRLFGDLGNAAESDADELHLELECLPYRTQLWICVAPRTGIDAAEIAAQQTRVLGAIDAIDELNQRFRSPFASQVATPESVSQDARSLIADNPKFWAPYLYGCAESREVRLRKLVGISTSMAADSIIVDATSAIPADSFAIKQLEHLGDFSEFTGAEPRVAFVLVRAGQSAPPEVVEAGRNSKVVVVEIEKHPRGEDYAVSKALLRALAGDYENFVHSANQRRRVAYAESFGAPELYEFLRAKRMLDPDDFELMTLLMQSARPDLVWHVRQAAHHL